MALLPPQVVDPLSECSSHVRVKGQLTGSTVTLFANGVAVGSGVATWSDQVFPLNAGVTLAAGAKVTATQALAGQTSPQSPQPVIVQKRPPVVGNVGCKTHIYQCGQCLWLDGMVPGATVDVKVSGVLRGSGRADDGTARIGLSQPTGPGEILVAQQTACGMPGLQTPLPAADPVPLPKDERVLPAPIVGVPLKECQRAVTVGNVFDGARVTLRRTAGPTETACFDRSSLWFPVPPLHLGETVTARQEYPGCKLTGQDSAGVTVISAKPVQPPFVVPPLCAGTTTVRLTGLLPGSKVHIFQNNTDLGEGEAPDSTFDFAVPPLAGNTFVTATQELCNNWSDHSNKVKVDAHPGALAAPVISPPLYECGAVVRVTNVHPGSTVYVYSTLLAAPIGSQQVYLSWADIPVSPQLIKGDKIFAVEVGCGQTVHSAPPVLVQPVHKPNPPQVLAPVNDCMRSVTVSNLLPGARVDIYVNNAWRGTADAGAATVEVPIFFGPLHEGDQVKACQHICQYAPVCGEPITVVSHVRFNYLTQHFDNARTGWRPYETVLTVANAPQLRKLFTHNVDGTIYAQPLYVHHVLMPGPEAHNVVYAATENDTVYAFDADTNRPALWQRSLIPPGEQIVSTADISGCDNIAPVIGITSTPVIDCATYTMFVVAKTKKLQAAKTTFHYRLYALDIVTGADRVAPVEVSGSFPGTGIPSDGHGHVVFEPLWHLNRPGLLLLNGVIYVGFSGHCDFHLDAGVTRYHGWVFGFNAGTLARTGVFCSCPDIPLNPYGRAGAGIWQAGMGLAGDATGFIYFTTGNGDLSANLPGGKNYGDTVVKLQANFGVADFFTPSDQPTLLDQDIDLGSGGVLILPDPPPRTHLVPVLVTCGKDGNLLLINRNNMGKYTPGGPDKLVQFPPIQLRPGAMITDQPGIWGGPAYYRSANQQLVYYCGNAGHLKAYLFSGNALAPSMVGANPNQSPQAFPSEGGVTPNV